MSYLHSLSPPLIHRDLKPDNVFLEFHGSDGTNHPKVRAKVADFGISTAKPECAAGETWGTYLYIPPEAYGETRSGAQL